MSRAALNVKHARELIAEVHALSDTTHREHRLATALQVAIEEIESWRRFRNTIDEALNSGDGTYEP